MKRKGLGFHPRNPKDLFGGSRQKIKDELATHPKRRNRRMKA